MSLIYRRLNYRIHGMRSTSKIDWVIKYRNKFRPNALILRKQYKSDVACLRKAFTKLAVEYLKN